MIGRISRNLYASAGTDVGELILDVCRRVWAGGFVQDADGDDVFPLTDPALYWRPPADEFFVYRSREVADGWDDLGPAPGVNWNDMLYFIVKSLDGSIRVTVTFDEVTSAMSRLLADLQSTLDDAAVYEEAA